VDPLRRSILALPPIEAGAGAHAHEIEPLLLTDAQRDWIRANPVVRYTVSFEARPFLFLEDGRPAGYVADLLARASRLTGLTFVHVPSRDRDDALRRLAVGEVALVPLMRIDDSRRARIPLTQPFATFTLGIFTRTDASYVDGLPDLVGLRVGMPRGMVASLSFDGPVPRFLPLDSTVDGLRGLRDGRYDAIVAPVPVGQYWIRRLGTDVAWMQATLPLKVPFGMAASADAAPLAGILDAVLRRVPAPERRAMMQAWTGSRESASGVGLAAILAGVVALAGAIAFVRRRAFAARAARAASGRADAGLAAGGAPIGRGAPAGPPGTTAR
jgi:two-component system sensor histidine kinase EvgS